MAYMNYIAVLNSFWDSVGTNPLSTGQVSLYVALLHVNNRSNWIEWFTVPNQVLSVLTGLSRSGILKARNELKQRGLIDFREKGTKATLYKMLTIANSTQDSKQISVQNGAQDGKQISVQKSNTLYKQKTETKTKLKSVTKVTPEKYVNDGALNDTVLAFVAFRRDIKAPMTDHAIDLMLKKLEDMAPGNNSAKVAILNQSIMNGWKGIFPLNDKNAKGPQPSGKRNQFQDFPQREIDYDALVMQQFQEENHGKH